jgi:hypothetical protein
MFVKCFYFWDVGDGFSSWLKKIWSTLDTLKISKKRESSKLGTLACPNLQSPTTLIPLICDDDDEPRKI